LRLSLLKFARPLTPRRSLFSRQLERLTESQQRKARQARRKAQEKKMRAVVRMQLRMAAPNIGALEAQDGALAGEDAFDLGEGERGLKGRRDLADALGDEGLELSSDSEGDDAASDGSDEFLESDDEREAKTAALENEMENLYGEYQSHMQDKDAKFRVKEARRKDKTRESWKGIDEDKGSDDESEEDDGEEGGWENKEKNRAAIGEEADSSDDETDMETEDGPRRSARNGNLLQKLDDGTDISTAAKVWFNQPVFEGLDEFEDDEEEEDAEMTDSDDDLVDEAEDEEAEEEAVEAARQMSDSEVRPSRG
jgi:AdoMet-dependent rRNA methyltransferase SPB1